MIRFASLMCLVLLAGLARADVYDDLAKLNAELKVAPSPAPKKVAQSTPAQPEFTDWYQAAVDPSKPAVIFVGIHPRRIKGYAVYTAKTMNGSTNFIGIAVPSRLSPTGFRLIRTSLMTSDETIDQLAQGGAAEQPRITLGGQSVPIQNITPAPANGGPPSLAVPFRALAVRSSGAACRT